MIFKTNIKIGEHDFIFEGQFEDIKDFFKQVAPLIVVNKNVCDLCGVDKIWPEYKEVQGNQYFSLKCSGCRAEYKYGQFKNGTSLFPKHWERFEPKTKAIDGET